MEHIENFEALIYGVTILMWAWMLTGGLQVICQRGRGIIHDRGYVTGWEDFITAFTVIGLLVVYGVI